MGVTFEECMAAQSACEATPGSLRTSTSSTSLRALEPWSPGEAPQAPRGQHVGALSVVQGPRVNASAIHSLATRIRAASTASPGFPGPVVAQA
jgi:hypothetical protein